MSALDRRFPVGDLRALAESYNPSQARTPTGQWAGVGGTATDVRAVNQSVGGTTTRSTTATRSGARSRGGSALDVNAVKTYQRTNGLQVDGVVGRQTLSSLMGRRGVAPGQIDNALYQQWAQMAAQRRATVRAATRTRRKP